MDYFELKPLKNSTISLVGKSDFQFFSLQYDCNSLFKFINIRDRKIIKLKIIWWGFDVSRRYPLENWKQIINKCVIIWATSYVLCSLSILYHRLPLPPFKLSNKLISLVLRFEHFLILFLTNETHLSFPRNFQLIY